MNRQQIINEVHRHINFFSRNWAQFCAWAHAVAQEWRKYDSEQNGPEYQANEDYIRADNAVRQADTPANQEALRASQQALDKAILSCQERRGQAAKKGWQFYDPDFVKWLNWPGRTILVPFYVPASFPEFGDLLLSTHKDQVSSYEEHVSPRPKLDKKERLLLDCAVLSIAHDADVSEPRALQICTWAGYEDSPFEFKGVYDLVKDSLSERERNGELERAWERVEPYVTQPALQDSADKLTQDRPTTGEVLHAPVPFEAGKGRSSETPAAEKNREKPWDDKRPGFILISKARKKYCDGSMAPTLAVLGRDHCKPDGEFDYMPRKQRRKVHEEQFAAYAERQGWTKAAEAKAIALTEACKEPRSRRARLSNEWDMKPEDYPAAGA